MTARLIGKKIAILVAHEFEDIELLYPILRLSEEGASILVAAVRMGFHPRPYLNDKPITGRFGTPVPIPVMPEGKRYRMTDLEDLKVQELDALLIPGGFSPDYLRRHAGILQLTRECHALGKVVAAICHAPWVLISAGILRGRRATGVVALRDDLINAGAEYLDEPVVVDGNLITSRAPNDLPEFCAAIIQTLSEGSA
jgi:protease I